MIIAEILKQYTLKLSQAKIPNPNLEAEILLSFVLKKPREFLLTHPEKIISKKNLARFALCITRRLKGEPIAYITGQKSFFGLDFIVNKNVLIPRPETEMMVEEAIHTTHNTQPITRKNGPHTPQKNIFIDLGTGSGCIIIAIAQNQKSKIQNPKYFAIDISKKALTIARKNAKKNKVDKKIKFLYGNLLDPILKPVYPAYRTGRRQGRSKIINPKSKIIILANLPYLTPLQVKNSPTIQFEPKLALVAGSDGLKYYRKLFKQIKKLQPKSYNLKAICEIDHTQAAKIKKLAQSEFPKCDIEIKKDLTGYERLAIIKPNT